MIDYEMNDIESEEIDFIIYGIGVMTERIQQLRAELERKNTLGIRKFEIEIEINDLCVDIYNDEKRLDEILDKKERRFKRWIR